MAILPPTNPYLYVPPKRPCRYQMSRCSRCRRSYRLPMSADPTLPALAECDRCWGERMKVLADELATVTGKAKP